MPQKSIAERRLCGPDTSAFRHLTPATTKYHRSTVATRVQSPHAKAALQANDAHHMVWAHCRVEYQVWMLAVPSHGLSRVSEGRAKHPLLA
jgi:hypothetical protein